jgi:hypothetical protein
MYKWKDVLAEKLDPFDVAGLERSLNDSATRVSTIWLSYLIFALYLVIATGTATHRQLLLEEPLKLPGLNIDLPLYWFFVLTPILFIIFHFYVLLQVLLLGRTAAAYNLAVDRTVKAPPGNASIRQRLANTLFAQIFAGSPREREGWLGWLLKFMAWITLALAPIYVVFAFQFVFLAYHSHLATWTHRLLIFVELAIAFLLLPLVFAPRKELRWYSCRRQARLSALIVFRLFSAKKWRKQALYRRVSRAAASSAFLLFALTSLLLSFPGEPHVNLLTLNSPFRISCDRLLYKFDRLNLNRSDVVDDEKLKKLQVATSNKGEQASTGERTRDFADRNLSCGRFDDADLRRVDFHGAILSGASLIGAELQGANLARARLDGAILSMFGIRFVQLQGANLFDAHLEGADLAGAQLEGANLDAVRMRGADLSDCKPSRRFLVARGATRRGPQGCQSPGRNACWYAASRCGPDRGAIPERGAL